MMYNNRFADNDKYKVKIDSYRPLDKDAVKQIQEYYRIGLTYSSNALEGNTLDLAETKIVLEDGLTIGGKPMKDHLEALGHSDAFWELLNLAKSDIITEANIKFLHKLFYNRINESEAGNYRTKNVIVTGSDIDFPKPNELSDKMQDFVKNIPNLKSQLHPVEYAAMLHAKFVNIHPFIDGNGRVARLLMNLALLQAGYNITIIPPVVRADYIRALQDSNHNNFIPFINFISEMVLESQKEYLRIVERLK
ncbi:Fic family protein [bacterium]|nr:Fic family protein [bacterium]